MTRAGLIFSFQFGKLASRLYINSYEDDQALTSCRVAPPRGFYRYIYIGKYYFNVEVVDYISLGILIDSSKWLI